MNRRNALFVLLVAFALPPAGFADGVRVKCSVNEDRVWLYDSIETFNVAAKLKCGDPVQVLGDQKGYVKVRLANGTEGFVPEGNLPKSVVPRNAAATPEAKPAPQQMSLASAARAAVAARKEYDAEVAAAAAGTPSAGTSLSRSAESSSATTAPAPSNEIALGALPQPTTVAASSPASKPATPSNPVRADSPKAANVATVSNVSAHSSPSVPHSRARVGPKPAASSTPAKPSSSAPIPAPARSPSTNLRAAAETSASPAPTSPRPASLVATSNVYLGPSPAASTPRPAGVRPIAKTSDDDEDADDDSYITRPKSESDDPACELYFSSYGLSPAQFKWMVDHRQKRFPTVCPAGSPSMVDYVMIFTHDVDFYNFNMPAPVHVEAGGFSDWNPIVEYDTTLVPRSEVDKSKREYVWVFHVKRGSFDPARFSPHRRFQFTKVESKYSRTLEDAFEFIENRGATR